MKNSDELLSGLPKISETTMYKYTRAEHKLYTHDIFN